MIPIESFTIARLPRIIFGDGAVVEVPDEVRGFGTKALVVTGERSLRAGAHWEKLEAGLRSAGISWESFSVAGEPSPELVDEAAAEYRRAGVEAVVGVGGGSALDAAKALAGLIPQERSVMDYLEGVGRELAYEGPSLPFVAVPTTAGTGSEVTKNAVLSRRGGNGFKKSFRNESLVARVAVVDPSLLASCPPELLAANGMDAFTQLLESYVSIRANPLTDALAWSGLEAFREGFFMAYEGRGEIARAGYSRLAYASLLSGISLAQTGLGSVHGLASPLGAFFPIPHGAACGTLVAEATDVNIRALKIGAPGSPALEKYARVGALFAGGDDPLEGLVGLLRAWTEKLALPRLGRYGVAETDIARVVANSGGSSMKTNPVVLSAEEVEEIIRRRL